MHDASPTLSTTTSSIIHNFATLFTSTAPSTTGAQLVTATYEGVAFTSHRLHMPMHRIADITCCTQHRRRARRRKAMLQRQSHSWRRSTNRHRCDLVADSDRLQPCVRMLLFRFCQYRRTYMHIHTYMCIHAYTYIYVHTCIYIHICAYIPHNTSVFTYLHTHSCNYIYTYRHA